MDMLPNKKATPEALEQILRKLQGIPNGAKTIIVIGAVILYFVPDVVPVVQDLIDLVLALTGFLIIISPKKED